MRKINSLLLLAVVLLIPFISSGQDVVKYPTKPITFIVIFAAGGGGDLSGRAVCKVAEGILGQSIIVENKPGGAGVIGANLIAKAKPDGYTIGGLTFSPAIYVPHLREVPFKTKEDFSFICQYAEYTEAFVVRTDAPWKTFKDFIEDARKNPGKLTYTTPGAKSSQYILIEQIAQIENVKLRHVPLASDAEMATAVLGGHVDSGLIAAIAPHIRSGALRGFWVDTEERWKVLPDIPTIKQLGYNVEKPHWIGVAGPKGIPGEILQKLEKAFEKAAGDPSVHKILEQIYMLPTFRSGEEFKKLVLREYDIQGELLKKFSD